MHGVFLIVSLAALLCIVAALVFCFRASAPKHKWLWALFIVLGIVRITLAPGDAGYKVTGVTVALPGARFVDDASGAARQLVLPMGAVVFLVRRRLQRR